MARVLAPEQAPPSTPRTDFGKKVRAHQRYTLGDGTLVPGVTTVVGVLNKPALVPWANKLGLQGIDTNKYVDAAALVGTLAHHMVEAHLGGTEPDLDDYSPAQVEMAQGAFEAFLNWQKMHTLEVKHTEYQMVSERWRFGGTIDCYGVLDGTPTLIDFKTSSGIYPEHHYQVAAYWRLLQEHGHEVGGVRIIRIPRDAGESLQEHMLTGKQVLHAWKIFEHCLALYELRKAEKRN